MSRGWRDHSNIQIGAGRVNNTCAKDRRIYSSVFELLGLFYRLHLLEITMTFDLIEGFNQVETLETHKPMCAFVIDWWLFEPNVMTVGLANATAMF